MSDAYECDRCGGLFPGDPEYGMLFAEYETRHSFEGQRYKDICEGCFNDFEQFWEEWEP